LTELAEGPAVPKDDCPSLVASSAGSLPAQWFSALRQKAAHPAVSNTAWILLERVGRMGIALVVGIVVVRYLGAERYGLYAYALTLAAIFVPLAGCGIGENLIRHLVEKDAIEGKVLGTACLLRAAAALLAVALTWSMFLVLPNKASMTSWDLAAALASMAALPLMVLDPYFQSLSRSRVVTICGLAAGVLAAGLKIAGVMAAAPVAVFLAAHAVEAILLATGLFSAYHLMGGRVILWGFDRSIATTLMREGLPMILAGFAILIYNQSDILLLGLLRNDHDVGVYSAAVRLSTLWLFLPMAIMTSAAPFLYRAQRSDENLYRCRLSVTMTCVVGISYLFAAAMSVFPEQLTMVVFGEDYVQAAPVLRIHVWSNVFSMLGMSQSTWYVGRGLLWLGVRNTLVGASANLVLNLLVIPEYGPQGAAATTLMATALTSIVLNSLDHRTAPLAKLQMQAIALMGCWSSFRPTAPTQR